MATALELNNDPKFTALPAGDKLQIARQLDPKFGGLPESDQRTILQISAGETIPVEAKPEQPLGATLDQSGLYESGEVNSNKLPIDARDRTKPNLLSDQVKVPVRKTIADFIRPTLEGGGMILGSPGGPTIEGMGYAAGKRIADVIEGKPDPVISDNPWLNPFLSAAQDAAAGTTMAMGGQVIGKTAGTLYDKLGKPILNKLAAFRGKDLPYPETGKNILDQFEMPFGKTAADRKAAEIWREDGTAASPRLQQQQAANRTDSDALLKRIGAETNFTEAQATNSSKMARNEQSHTAVSKEFADELKLNDALIQEAAHNNLVKNLPASSVFPAAPLAEQIGAAQRGTLKAGEIASKQDVGRAYNEIDDYLHPTSNFMDSVKNTRDGYWGDKAEAAIDQVVKVFESKPPTTKHLIEVDKLIGRLIGDNLDTPTVMKALKLIRKGNGETLTGLRGDFQAMGEAAQRGDVALHNGKLVMPSEITAKIAEDEARIAKEMASGATLKEKITHLRAAIVPYGQNYNGVLRDTDEGIYAGLSEKLKMLQAGNATNTAVLKSWPEFQKENAHLLDGYIKEAGWKAGGEARLKEEYAKYLKETMPKTRFDYTPPVGGANQQIVKNIEDGIAANKDILANLTPANDVAAQYATAHGKAVDHFRKYGTDTIKKVLAYGDTLGGGRIAESAISQRLFTTEGARELINTVGPKAAAQQTAPHVVSLLSQTVENGVMDLAKAHTILNNNRAILKQLGLEQFTKDLMKGQVKPAILKDLADQSAKRSTNLTNNLTGEDTAAWTAQQSANWAKKNVRIFQDLYGGTEEVRAMQDFAKTMKILGRNKNVSYSGGSTTWEKRMTEAPAASYVGKLRDNLVTVISSIAGGVATGGLGGAYVAGKASAAVGKATTAHQTQMVTEIFRKALAGDPEAALFLNKVGKGRKVTPTEINNIVKTLTGYALLQPE